jgi:hypothetical protein
LLGVYPILGPIHVKAMLIADCKTSLISMKSLIFHGWSFTSHMGFWLNMSDSQKANDVEKNHQNLDG